MGEGKREQLKAIEAEYARTQKNKATEGHLGRLKAKMAKLRVEIQMEDSASTKGGGGESFDVKASGHGAVALIGKLSISPSPSLSLSLFLSVIYMYSYTFLMYFTFLLCSALLFSSNCFRFFVILVLSKVLQCIFCYPNFYIFLCIILSSYRFSICWKIKFIANFNRDRK